MWSSSWPVVKDIVLTGVGLALILKGGLSDPPILGTLGAGVVLTGGIATFHVGKLLSARVDGRPLSPSSTPPPAPPGSSSSPSELEGTDD